MLSKLLFGCEWGGWKSRVPFTQASELLRKMCTRNLVQKYCCGITAERKALVGTWAACGGRTAEGRALALRLNC